MKRWLTSAVAFGAILAGTSTASATAYPPPTDAVVATPRVIPSGGDVDVETPCVIGDMVLVRLGDRVATAGCDSTDGASPNGSGPGFSGRTTIKIAAPNTPGDHRGTVSGSSSGDIGSFVVQVVPVDVATGSESSARFTGTIDINWTDVTRYTTLGAMAVLMMAAAILNRRRLGVT